jgi:hypothetical protein
MLARDRRSGMVWAEGDRCALRCIIIASHSPCRSVPVVVSTRSEQLNPAIFEFDQERSGELTRSRCTFTAHTGRASFRLLSPSLLPLLTLESRVLRCQRSS